MAAITTFATLKTEVAAWLHRSDITTDIAGFVQFGQNRIYRDLRVRCMESAFSTAISSGTIALPTRYRELKFAYIDGTPVQRLMRKDSEWMYAAYPTRSTSGKPEYIARQGETFIFGPYPDSAYTVKGIAYCGLAALSADGDTNWFIDNVPELLLFASLCEAAPWMKEDSRVTLWERKYAQIATQVQEQDDQEEFSGSPIAVTAR